MLNDFIMMYGSEIIGLVLCAIAGAIGLAAKKVWNDHLNDDTKRAIAWTVVKFVEQVWKDIHGKQKLQKALEAAEVLLRKKTIPFDADEMMILIEAAVAEMNDVFHKELPAPATCGYAYDATEGSTEADTEWKDWDQ